MIFLDIRPDCLRRELLVKAPITPARLKSTRQGEKQHLLDGCYQ